MSNLTGPVQAMVTTGEDRAVEVGVSSVPAGGTATVLSAFDVSIAFTPPGVAPGASDFTAAAWTGNTVTISDVAFYVARVIVGAGGDVALTAGLYDVWISVDTTAEEPMVQCPGRILVVTSSS